MMGKAVRSLMLGTGAIGLVFLSGCNLAPKYSRPPAQTPQAFKEAVPHEYKEGDGWKLAQPGDEKIRSKWWEVYNDSQLNALEEQVAISNQSIALAEANFRSARAAVAFARSSLFPRISTSPSYSRSKFSETSRGATVIGGGSVGNTGQSVGGTGTGSGSTGTGAGTGSGTGVGGTANTGILNTYSATANIAYEVDLWHRIRNQIAANTLNAQASAADIATATLSVQAELAQDYFEIRALDAQRAILRETVDNYRQTLDLTKLRFQGGIVSDEDVSQAQNQLDTAIAQETDVSVARATYEHAIATLMGKPASSFALPVAPFISNPPAIPVAVPSALLERRPDIAGAERQVASANAQIGVAKAAFYPTLSLSASGGFQTSQFNRWFDWPSHLWSIGPSFAETLFDAGARRATTDQAIAAYEGTVATYRQTVLTAFQAVEDQLSTLSILSKEISEQRTAVASARHYLDLSLVRYRGGVDSYLNVITAQNSLLSNRQTELQIELRQMTASVALILSLGGGWDPATLPTPQQLAARPDRGDGKGLVIPGTTQPPVVTTPQPTAAPNPPALPQQR
jgi:NodT family efflux transporter outer membrane factor (OMF) lipoprotein